MEKWQENRNYRKIRDENGTVVANIITVDGRDVAVTEDVFAAYAQMDRRERYLSEDLPTGKVLSMEQLAEDGVLPDYVGAETAPSAEDCVLARESEREREELTSLLLAALIIESLLGFTPREMAAEWFIFMLGITMVAAPGVPGGAIMAALGILQSMLGFDESAQALMIALYIAMDSFGTACNVTGDGAIALIIDKIMGKNRAERLC